MATISEDIAPKRGSLLHGFRIQIRVIGALIMRELHTRYGRENIGYVWLILEPMLLASMVALIHSRGGNIHNGDIKPIPLSILGYCNFMVFRSIFSRSEGALESNIPLMYHRTVKPFDILLARGLLETAGCWVAFAILMGAAVVMGMAEMPARPMYLIAGMTAMAGLAFGGGMVICGLTYERKAIGRLVHPITYVMMPLSGAFFTMSMLPGPLRDAFLWVPLVHISELLRYGWFNAATDHYIDYWYLGKCLLGSYLMGLLLLSTVRKRIHMS